jgi:hypothetical protein
MLDEKTKMQPNERAASNPASSVEPAGRNAATDAARRPEADCGLELAARS